MPELRPQITIEDFAKLDLRVARVVACEPHPNADRLLKLQVDLGELGQRQICAGIKGHYEPQELVGKIIIVVANLAPRKIRGEDSTGMLLAASIMDGAELRDIVILTPLREAPAGSTVG